MLIIDSREIIIMMGLLVHSFVNDLFKRHLEAWPGCKVYKDKHNLVSALHESVKAAR